MRALYVVATWGPEPFAREELERVAEETDDFFRASSAGRVSLPGTVAAPLRLPRDVFDSCDATALRAAAPAEVFAGYDRVVVVTPPVERCEFLGEANPTEVLLNGALSMPLAAHELGHTFGLGHASRWDCVGRRCSIEEYGNGFSVMGGGAGTLNAYEKAQLEWLTGIVRPGTRASSFEIGPVDGPTRLPQALVVTTAASEFWLESRGSATPSFLGGVEQPAGIPVVAGPVGGAAVPSRFPRHNLLLPNPAGQGRRFAFSAGEAFVDPGVFRVTVERHDAASAALRFAWLDRVAPRPPSVRVRTRGRARVQVSWDPATERGSGVRSYALLVDGRARRMLDGTRPYVSAVTLRLSRGEHRIAVLATDRAGNRGRPTVVRVRVR